MLRIDAGTTGTTTGTTTSPHADIGEYQGQRLAKQIQYLEIVLTSFELLNNGEIKATFQFSNVNRAGRGLALCLRAEGSGGIMDFWKFNPTPIASVTDDKGNKYTYSEQSGLGSYCRDEKDWLILKDGEQSVGSLSFRSSSRAVPGSVFSLTADLRIVTRNGERQQVSESAMQFANIRPRKR